MASMEWHCTCTRLRLFRCVPGQLRVIEIVG